MELLVSSPTRSPFEEQAVVSRLQGLRRPFYVETQELDAEATLEESLRRGDFTPRYCRRAVAPEYLVLIERASAEDHSAALASSLVAALVSSHVYVDVYYFSSDIRRLFSGPEASRISLEEVLSRHGSHRLILVTNGNSLLDPVSGKLQNWARRFEEFAHRLLITPTPAGLWGYRELALSAAMRIDVLPLLPASVPMLVRLLAEPVQAVSALPAESDRATGSLEGLADVLEQRIGGWLSSAAPDTTTIEALERAMRQAFTPEGMRWLAACAVYPELKWNLTLYIGATLRGATGAPAVDAGELLRLSLLPWFRDGRMPEWLRAQVLATLPTQDYARIRALYNRLLKSTFSASRKNTMLNIGVESSAVSDPDTSEPTARDQIVADFVSGLARKDRTSFRVAGAVTRRLLARMSRGHFRNSRVEDEIKETLADADALHITVAQMDVHEATVTGVVDEALAGMACFRQVANLQDRSGNPVDLAENLMLFVPTGHQTAILLNEASAWRFQQRSRMSLRIATLNFLFVALAAVWFSDSILSEYPEGVGVFVVCLWLTLPYLAVEAILVRRMKQRFERFPKFKPVGNFAHKSHRFVVAEGAVLRPDGAPKVETPA